METILQAKNRIEKEFDEPLAEVVAGFAEMKYSRRLVAESLEVSFESLKHFNRRNGIRFHRSPSVHREIRGRRGRRVCHDGREMNLTQWAAELGVSVECVRKRLRTRGSVA